MGWLSPRGEQREQPRFGKALYWHFPPPLAVLCLLGVVAAGTGGAGPGEGAGGHPVGMGHAAMGGLFWHPYSRLSHLSFFNFSSAGQTSSSFHAGKCAQPRLLAPCPPPALCPPPTPLTTTTTTRPVTCLCWACRGRVGCGLRGALCHHSTGLHVLRLQAAQPERTVSGGQSRVGGTAVPPPIPLHTAVWETSVTQTSFRGFPLCPNTLLFVPRQAGLAHQIQGHLHSGHHREHSVSPAAQPRPLAPTPGSGGTSLPRLHRLFTWGNAQPQQIFLLQKTIKTLIKKAKKGVRASCAAGHLCRPRSKPRSDAGPFPSQSLHPCPRQSSRASSAGLLTQPSPALQRPGTSSSSLFVQSLGKTAAGAW